MADEQAESSSADEQEYQEPDLDKLTPEQRGKWLETGKVPVENAEESATSKSEGEGSETAAESESAPKDTQEEATGKPHANAEVRKKQLAAEIQDLLEQRRKLREEVSKPAEAARAESQPAAKPPDRPKRPKLEQFEGDNAYEKYEDALDKYEEDLADWKVGQRIEAEKQAHARTQQQQTIAQRNAEVKKNWETRLADTKARHPDYMEVVKNGDIPLNPIMDGYLLDSEIGPEVVYHLSQHPEEAERIAKLSPFATARELAKLETQIGDSLKKQTPARPKIVTAAKKPPAELSGRNLGAEDEIQAAIETDDVGRYLAAANAAEVAKIVRR